jgi:hypothetical protein
MASGEVEDGLRRGMGMGMSIGEVGKRAYLSYFLTNGFLISEFLSRDLVKAFFRIFA